MTAPLRSARRMRVETGVFVAVTAIALTAIGVGLPLSPEAQIVTLAVLVAVLGLPHGALDPLIAQRLGLWSTARGFAAFNLGYLAIVLAVIGVWMLAPAASLVAFLVVSSVHFGGDWNADRPAWIRIATGVGLLSLPAFAHREDVAGLYRVLAGPAGQTIADAQAWFGPLAIAGMLVGAAVAFSHRRSDSLEIVLAGVLAVIAPPLVFFAIYFCALHSARHLREGFAAQRDRGRLTILIAVVYTVAPVVVVLVFLIASGGAGSLDDRMLQVVFVGLAGLTVPHMVLVALEGRSPAVASRPVYG